MILTTDPYCTDPYCVRVVNVTDYVLGIKIPFPQLFVAVEQKYF